jgi:hypothetical protein
MLVLALSLLGCAASLPGPSSNFPGSLANLPAPAESEYLKTTVGTFLINRAREVQYVLRCDVIKAIPEEITLRVEYENPVNPAAPIVQESTLSPGQQALNLESPILPGIQNRGIYTVRIIGSIERTGTQILRHEQAIQFILPPGI